MALTETNGTALATREDAAILEQVIAQGDLKALTPPQRVAYYRDVCRSLNLNPLTRPFEYIVLNGKLTLYARKDCTDQLRKLHAVSITKLERDNMGEIYAVTAYATDANGRSDSAIGAVPITGLRGEPLANALMKAESKAKRRVTLSLCGLGWTDESEVDSIPTAQTVVVDSKTGEILETRPPAQANSPSDMVTSAEHPMWQRWLKLRAEAERLNLLIEFEQPMTLPIPRSLLQAEGARVRAAVDEAKEKLATAGSPSTAPTAATTERSALWARNRELCDKAAELGVTGIPTLNTRATDSAIAQANAELERRVREHEAKLADQEPEAVF